MLCSIFVVFLLRLISDLPLCISDPPPTCGVSFIIPRDFRVGVCVVIMLTKKERSFSFFTQGKMYEDYHVVDCYFIPFPRQNMIISNSLFSFATNGEGRNICAVFIKFVVRNKVNFWRVSQWIHRTLFIVQSQLRRML